MRVLQLRQSHNGGAEPLISRRRPMPVEPWSGVSSAGPSGVWGAARAHSLVRNRRGPSARPASGKDQGYKPMVKSLGGQRESEGVVVPLIGVRDTPGGKDPCFDHAREAGKRKGMTGSARSNYPGKSSLAVADGEPLCPSGVKARELQRALWAAAKQSSGRRFHAVFDRICRGDVLWEAWERVRQNRGCGRGGSDHLGRGGGLRRGPHAG